MTQNDDLVSIIIPAYNATATLARCLQSVSGQTYPHFEAILVNDGSTDNTRAIAEDWAARDCRIHVLNKENGGVGAARNSALEIARGEWITFVDADDYLEPNFLERLLTGDRCDLSVIGYHTVGEHEIPEQSYPETVATDSKSIKTLLESHLTDMTFLCPWGKLFQASIIKSLGLKFNTDMRIGEDVVFVWSYIARCSSIALKPGQCYNYHTAPADFKYAVDEETAIMTINRIFEPLDALAAKNGMNPEKAQNHILNYYIWLYKLYVKRSYGKKDTGRMASFFYQPLILGYFKRNKWKSKDKAAVYLLLKLHLTGLLYKLIKLYY